MPFDAFLYFEGHSAGSAELKGETQDDDFKKKNAFEIKSFSFGVENASTIGSGTTGGGGGKCQFSKFTVKKNTDTASTAFFQNMASGTHYDKAYLSLRKGGGGTVSGIPYLTYMFRMVFVTKMNWSGSGGGNEDQPEEDIEFAYGALKVNYFPQKRDGSMGKVVESMWSQVLNCESDEVKPSSGD